MKLLEKYRAWRKRRQDEVIAKAVLLGLEIEHIPSGWIRVRPDLAKLQLEHYRAGAPVHGSMGSVSVYGRTPYQVAKRYLKMQELI